MSPVFEAHRDGLVSRVTGEQIDVSPSCETCRQWVTCVDKTTRLCLDCWRGWRFTHMGVWRFEGLKVESSK